jgi:ER membrane protein complex subunit 3
MFLVKLPFPLTLRFKPMLQRGIETYDMDVAWVSSLSWYFINLMGLRGVFELILGDQNSIYLIYIFTSLYSSNEIINEIGADGMNDLNMAANMQQQQAMGQQQDMSKVFQSERDSLDLVLHDWSLLKDAEVRLVKILADDLLSLQQSQQDFTAIKKVQ